MSRDGLNKTSAEVNAGSKEALDYTNGFSGFNFDDFVKSRSLVDCGNEAPNSSKGSASLQAKLALAQAALSNQASVSHFSAGAAAAVATNVSQADNQRELQNSRESIDEYIPHVDIICSYFTSIDVQANKEGDQYAREWTLALSPEDKEEVLSRVGKVNSGFRTRLSNIFGCSSKSGVGFLSAGAAAAVLEQPQADNELFGVKLLRLVNDSKFIESFGLFSRECSKASNDELDHILTQISVTLGDKMKGASDVKAQELLGMAQGNFKALHAQEMKRRSCEEVISPRK